QFKTTYNISIVALEEAKGTLLAYDNIAVAEGPYPRKAYIQALDQQSAHRRLPIPPDGNFKPVPVNGPAALDPIAPNPPPDAAFRRHGPAGSESGRSQRPAAPTHSNRAAPAAAWLIRVGDRPRGPPTPDRPTGPAPPPREAGSVS